MSACLSVSLTHSMSVTIRSITAHFSIRKINSNGLEIENNMHSTLWVFILFMN
uniref:Uncharacterized protein n=1 Tax=Anguilla anguilla TaxID=7936 RepID=A0A0E9Q6C7_ANGAN